MLFSKYNLSKNHGDFVHLNMLKWALKHVPEIGNKTVPASETVDNVEIGTGGVDIKFTEDATGKTNSRHVPYTDFQVNGESQPVFNIETYENKEARMDTDTGVFFDQYTKVIDDSYFQGQPSVKDGISFYDKDTIKVDGIGKNYITKLKSYYRQNDGTLIDAYEDKEFKPYTSVIRDDDSLASKLKIKHDSAGHLTGINFPATNEAYNIEVTKASLFNMVYPVGSIYMSAGEVSPATLFGGQWQKLEDEFLLGASTDHPLGSSGGEAQHTLTIEEMPVHTHIEQAANSISGNAGRSVLVDSGTDETSSGFKFDLHADPLAGGWVKGKAIETMSAGYNKPHNNMPPYLAVNIWKRTA